MSGLSPRCVALSAVKSEKLLFLTVAVASVTAAASSQLRFSVSVSTNQVQSGSTISSIKGETCLGGDPLVFGSAASSGG